MSRNRAGLIALAIVLIGAIGWIATKAIDQFTDERHRRSLYDHFEPPPGTREISAVRYEITSDSGGTGDFGLRVTFQLPDDATAAEVIDHYRSQIPSDWSTADDQLCDALRNRQPPPPTNSAPVPIAEPEPEEPYQLMLVESRLTVFPPGGSPIGEGNFDGITFELQRVGDDKYVIADQPTFACGFDDEDRFATEFDRQSGQEGAP